MEGLRTDEETVTMVVTLLSYGCPIQAIVHAFDQFGLSRASDALVLTIGSDLM
jgi:hypothetical protein